MVEQGPQGQLNTRFLPQLPDQAKRQQRVASECEEVVVQANPLCSRQLSKEFAEDVLQGACRRHVFFLPHMLRQRQGGHIELAVRGQRQPLQPEKERRDHIVGQAPAQPLAKGRGRRQGLAWTSDEVGRQARFPGDHASLHRGLGDLRQRAQRRLDLARLDAEAADLELAVGPPEEVEAAVLAPAGQITRAIHA